MFKLGMIPRRILGPPRNPLDPEARRRVLLVALLAWAGLGANGLSSACYGPEKAFLALAAHTELAPFLALATVATVFIIALAYGQVVELFPSGGGNYKIVSQLLGARFGVVAGAALFVDYVLTIAVSLVSGTDALFSLLPAAFQGDKLWVELGLALLLIILNLRGIQESIRFLLPIVLFFVLVHGFMIFYGILSRAGGLGGSLALGAAGTVALSRNIGWPAVAALFLRAYYLGGSTYAGSEAIANNVNLLAEPRVRTGRATLLYCAASLALIAGGLVLLYTLWNARPVYGQTLNALVFKSVLANLGIGPQAGHALLLLALFCEGAILFVAANSILIFAPSLLANMATDSWLPHRFQDLSDRLVRQNGVLFVGGCAVAVLVLSRGELGLLIILYSINVFLSLALAKAGLCKYWWHRRHQAGSRWLGRGLIAAAGLLVASSILIGTLTEKFFEGGWVTLCLTLLVIGVCYLVRSHYDWVEQRRGQLDSDFSHAVSARLRTTAEASPGDGPSAVILTTQHWGAAIQTLLWVQRLFPGRFKGAVFIGIVKVEGDVLGPLDRTQQKTVQLEAAIDRLEAFCAHCGIDASHQIGYGIDPVAELEKLVKEAVLHMPGCVCFTNKLIFPDNNWLAGHLHYQTALVLQRRLHLQGIPLVVFPLRLN